MERFEDSKGSDGLHAHERQPVSWLERVKERLRNLFTGPPVVYISDPNEKSGEVSLPIGFAENVARMHGGKEMDR